jgi:hypothetical protein
MHPITEPGAYPPVTTQAPDEGIAVGDYAAGTDVTIGDEKRGRVIEIIPPPKYSGQHGNWYRIVGADDRTHCIDGPRLLDPTADAEAASASAATPAAAASTALAAATAAGADHHRAAVLATAAYEHATADACDA